MLIVRLLALAMAIVGCSSAPPDRTRATRPNNDHAATVTTSRSAERRGIGVVSGFAAAGGLIQPASSLAITDKSILGRFEFKAVVERLACDGVAGCTTAAEREAAALQLFRQWRETQLTSGSGSGPFCTNPMFGFPYDCNRREAMQPQNPFTRDEHGFLAIGLFNRIDLADADGRDCGEYRIVFARRSGQDVNRNERLFIIVEAVLENTSGRGLAGCYDVAKFWADLDAKTATARADALLAFYFDGLVVDGVQKFGAVLQAANLGARSCPDDYPTCTGQIRTNHFMQRPWLLREFRLHRDCGTCAVQALPRRVAQGPAGRLFGEPVDDRTRRFHDHLIRSLPALLWTDNVNLIGYTVPDEFLSGQSQSCNAGADCLTESVEGNYSVHLGVALRDRLQAAIDEAGLTKVFAPAQVVERVKALSCAGCHKLSAGGDIGGRIGDRWPVADFVHVSERTTDAQPSFTTSPALATFLQHRATKLAAVLKLGP